MLNRRLNLFDRVHCRTGSLESGMAIAIAREYVHCRTGSLEIANALRFTEWRVHCRTGSLENLRQRNAIQIMFTAAQAA